MRTIILTFAFLTISTSSIAQTDIEDLKSAIKILDEKVHDYDRRLSGFKEYSTKSKAKRLYDKASSITDQISDCISLSKTAYNSYEEDDETRRSIRSIISSLNDLYEYADKMVDAAYTLKNISCLTDNLYEEPNCPYKTPFNKLVDKYNDCLPSFNNMVTYINKL